jgi:alpha-1,2-mannosyltransferase
MPSWSSRMGRLPLVATMLIMAAAALYLAHWSWGESLDLRVYRAAIDAWRGGHDPYVGRFTSAHLSFTYPPVALAVLTPLTLVPYRVAQVGLWVLSIAALSLSIDVVSRACGRVGEPLLRIQTVGWAGLAVLVLEPVRSTLNFDQINTLLMALVVGDLLVVRRSRRGLLIGLAGAIKLTPLIFLVIAVLERDTKTLLRGIGTFVVTQGLMAAAWPSMATTYWLHDAFDARRVGGIAYAGNQSWFGVVHRWPFSPHGNTLAYLLLAAATLAAAFVIARRGLHDGRRVDAMVAMALCGLLISPISWSHHWVWVALIPVVVRRARRGMTVPVRAMLGVVLALAVVAPYWWTTAGGWADVLTDSLVLGAAAALAVWAVSSLKPVSTASPHPTVGVAQE